MNNKFYKYCAVPMCKNTTIKTPEKVFVFVPRIKQIREQWFELARKDTASFKEMNNCYYCADHFDLQNDMENYLEYTMGYVSHIRMRPGCIPSKFDCQLNRDNISSDFCQPTPIKRRRLETLIEECEKELDKNVANIEKPQNTEHSTHVPSGPSTSSDQKLRMQWEIAVRRKNFKATKHSRLCSDHFKAEDYVIEGFATGIKLSRRILKKGVIPSLFICSKKETIRDEPRTKRAERREEWRQQTVQISVPADGTVDATTSSGVCQVIEEDVSVALTLQTSYDVPVDVDESCHSSSTESADSSPDDTSNFMTLENTQTSVADESMDYSIYRFKCNTIIANVYHYLQQEYVSLKSQLGGLCDVSALSNTLARTAAATGVSQDEVEIALREAALHSDQTSKPEETHSSGVRRPRIIRRNKRRSKTLEDKSDNSVRPAKRKATSKSVPSKPIDEEQLPFPAPIQLRVLGVETECKIEPVDELPTMDDPLDAESSSHCGIEGETEIEIKTEPVDDESPQKIKDDPLALEWTPTALQEPSDPPDFTKVKSEHVDHDYADMCWDPSTYDKKRPDIEPKLPSQ